MSCLFWRIGTIRPSAVDDSETNKHQTCLHNSLCCIASWHGEHAGEEKRRRSARQTAGLAGRRLDRYSDSSLSLSRTTCSWWGCWVGVMIPSSQENMSGLLANEAEVVVSGSPELWEDRAWDWLRSCQIKFRTSWERSGPRDWTRSRVNPFKDTRNFVGLDLIRGKKINQILFTYILLTTRESNYP